MTKKEKDAEYLKFKKQLDSEINVYRMGNQYDKRNGCVFFHKIGLLGLLLWVPEHDTHQFGSYGLSIGFS